MHNYVINNSTIAILKSKNKTVIIDVNNYRVLNKSIKTVLQYNCFANGSSLMGRIKSAQIITKCTYKVPILINDEITLLQLNSLRSDFCLLIVTNKIIDYKKHNGKVQINCINNMIFNSNISINTFEKMILNSIKINNALKYQKIKKFL